ncbi:sterol o-acyltransferase [Vairimorpha apis BRL 01]|uniref:diacylglycerol O-acyltransferase n=1 Tax=Vairimorpha apis BRL 01 TaxID=1037528 RepID=T0MLT1_9MICR|nr:sterol o-acyltransferase [Vairimorpha apis BRL 01]
MKVVKEQSHSTTIHKITRTKITYKITTGIYNLVIIIAILSISKFLLEDYKEFGWIMSIPLADVTYKDVSYFLLVLLFIFVRSILIFFIVKFNYRYIYSIIVCLYTELIVCYINFKYIQHAYLAGWALSLGIIYLAKIVSFLLVQNETKGTNVKPLKFKHFLYFLIVPTLCYQSVYPMLVKRNYKKIGYRFIQFLVGFFLFVFVSDQYSIPSIYRIIDMKNFSVIFENTINLVISTALMFLIFFHLVFVCSLDIIAEITLFHDNTFYQSWWNSTTAAEFWAMWNVPVHKWFKRHIYKPLLINKYGKLTAQTVCFFISALVHEYVLSVSTKKFCGWLFIGMMAQVPYIYITQFIERKCPYFANFFFWILIL